MRRLVWWCAARRLAIGRWSRGGWRPDSPKSSVRFRSGGRPEIADTATEGMGEPLRTQQGNNAVIFEPGYRQ